MKIHRQLVKRNIAGDVILVPVGDASLELKGLLTLNETGERIWDLLPDAASEDEIFQALLEEYDVEPSVLRTDVDAFFAKLRELAII